MTPRDPLVSHMTVGDFAIVRYPEIHRITSGSLLHDAPGPLPSSLDADDLFLFFRRPIPTHVWAFLVTTEQQRAQLVEFGRVPPARIFTRSELEAEFVKLGHDPAALESIPLLDLLKATIPPSKEPTVTDAASSDDQIPPDDRNLWRPEPKIVEKLDGPDNPWMEPLRAWISRQDPETQALIPQGSDFWLNGAWMIGDDNLPCGLLLSTSDQAAVIASINARRVAGNLDAIPTWGPDELQPYYGTSFVIIPPEQLALTACRIYRDSTRATATGIRLGEQRAATHLANLTTTAPVATAALLSLWMAREVCSKNLLACDADELKAINDATGKLLLAVGLANARPLTPDDLPKPYEKPSPPLDGPPPGQYI